MPWPAGEPNLCVLVEETRWPIEAGTVDRLIVAHGLETCDSPEALLAEIWRVLAPGGRVVFIVPNRSGLWARRDVTPFGFGRPYSLGQLEGLLRTPPPRAGAPRRRALRAALAPPVLAADRPLLGAPRPPLRAPRHRRRAPRRGLEAGLRPPARVRLQGRRARPARRPRGPDPAQPRSPCAATARRCPRRPPAKADIPRRFSHRAQRIATPPTLCYQRPDFAGERRANLRQNHSRPPAGGRGQNNGKGVGGQLSFIDLWGSGPLRDRALRNRQGRQAARRGRARHRRDRGRSTPTAPTSASSSPRPVHTREEQGRAIAAIAAAMGLGTTVTNTLGLMAQNRRLFVVPGLIAQVKALIAAERGEVTAEVTSAKPLTKAPGRGAGRHAEEERRQGRQDRRHRRREPDRRPGGQGRLAHDRHARSAPSSPTCRTS